jgi:hypothetical protein
MNDGRRPLGRLTIAERLWCAVVPICGLCGSVSLVATVLLGAVVGLGWREWVFGVAVAVGWCASGAGLALVIQRSVWKRMRQEREQQ